MKSSIVRNYCLILDEDELCFFIVSLKNYKANNPTDNSLDLRFDLAIKQLEELIKK